jgi:hypothetical protein
MLLNRMLLGLRANLLSDRDLFSFAEGLLSAIATHNSVEDQVNEVVRHCGNTAPSSASPIEILHALNAYQSSERFKGDFITTGTVMVSHDNSRWWVCVEPACSAVPSQAPQNANFMQCQLLELFKASDEKAVIAAASRSNHLFVVHNGKRVFLSVINEFDQPILRIAYVPKNDQIRTTGEKRESVLSFPSLNADRPAWQEVTMQIIAQLHEPYANRLLHLTGHHLSRIGLDFVDHPQVSDAACQRSCVKE